MGQKIENSARKSTYEDLSLIYSMINNMYCIHTHIAHEIVSNFIALMSVDLMQE